MVDWWTARNCKDLHRLRVVSILVGQHLLQPLNERRHARLGEGVGQVDRSHRRTALLASQPDNGFEYLIRPLTDELLELAKHNHHRLVQAQLPGRLLRQSRGW
jgi:hypothetical protein